MCFAKAKTPPVQSAPMRDENASLAQSARMTALSARGVRDTIATSPLGDSGFGANVRRVTLGGGGMTAK